MKKISFLFSILAISTALYAQPPRFGLKAGVNIASTSNNVSGQSGSKAGLHAGLLSHIHLSPAVSLQPEVNYSRQGGKVGNVDLNLDYLNIPLQLQYNFDNGFRLQTGPQLGLLLNASDKQNGVETNYFSTDDFKTTDLSWTLGLGYLTYSGLGIDARYNLGLSKINDVGAGSTKNRVFQIGLFYMFDHRHKAKSR